MSLFYVVARGIPFRDRRKKSVVVGVTVSRERANSIKAATSMGTKKVDVVTTLDGTEWMGPGGKLEIKRMLRAEQERIEQLIEDRGGDMPQSLVHTLNKLREAEARL